VIVHCLLTGGRVHERARDLLEGRRLIGHRVGDDGVVIHRDGDGLAHGYLIQPIGIQVVEGSGKAGADAVGRLRQVSGNRQTVALPQQVDVGVELLTDVHLALGQSHGTGRVVLEDHMRQVLRRGQLAPHGGILTPVVIIPHEDYLRVIGEILVIGAGVHDVLRGVRHQLGGVITGALLQLLGPGLLHDVVAAHESAHRQRIDGLPIFRQLGLDHHGPIVLGHDVLNVVLVAGAGRGVVLDVSRPGVSHILRRHGGAVTPLGRRLDLEGDLRHIGVP